MAHTLQYKAHLLTWSTQGMEKSHYQAPTSFFRSTRHRGGQIKSNALKELFNWFYRRQLQRLCSKQHENEEPTNEECTEEANLDQDYMDLVPTNVHSS